MTSKAKNNTNKINIKKSVVQGEGDGGARRRQTEHQTYCTDGVHGVGIDVRSALRPDAFQQTLEHMRGYVARRDRAHLGL
jgi:hypothetical protein